jgi:hypothetical protein
MEHATPEQFWVDKTQCRYVDENGQTKNPTLSDCGQAVSTVKALAIAQQQGQKIYTITPQNASTVLAKLPVSGSVGQEIRNAVQAGKEVTVHEKSVSAYGWTGYGYSIVDPETGAGAYIIEGGGNGAILEFVQDNSGSLTLISMILGLIGGYIASAGLAAIPIIIGIAISASLIYDAYLTAMEKAGCEAAKGCILGLFTLGFSVEVVFGAIGIFASGAAGIGLILLSIMFGLSAALGAAPACDSIMCRTVPEYD